MQRRWIRPKPQVWRGDTLVQAENDRLFERALGCINGEKGSAAGLTVDDLLAFFADRLKVYLRDRGARHDLLDAVFALGEDDLVLIVARINALENFLKTEDGASLLAGYKRAANILKAEEKKDGAGAFEAHPDAKLRAEPEENALAEALDRAEREAQEAVRCGRF